MSELLERLGLYLVLVVLGVVFGAAAYAAINLAAPALGLPGGQGPWLTVMLIGARVGAIGAAVGGLTAFIPRA